MLLWQYSLDAISFPHLPTPAVGWPAPGRRRHSITFGFLADQCSHNKNVRNAGRGHRAGVSATLVRQLPVGVWWLSSPQTGIQLTNKLKDYQIRVRYRLRTYLYNNATLAHPGYRIEPAPGAVTSQVVDRKHFRGLATGPFTKIDASQHGPVAKTLRCTFA
jgi:hypothetical protein